MYMTLEFDQNKVSRGQKVILVQQRKQAKIGFETFCSKYIKLCLVNIGNMDETPVWFDMPTSKTVDSVGAKTVLLKTTGHGKTRFTVVLACLADGTKLKPNGHLQAKNDAKRQLPRWRSGT